MLSIFGCLMKYVWLCKQLWPLKLRPNIAVVVFKLLGLNSSGCFLVCYFKTDDN